MRPEEARAEVRARLNAYSKGEDPTESSRQAKKGKTLDELFARAGRSGAARRPGTPPGRGCALPSLIEQGLGITRQA